MTQRIFLCQIGPVQSFIAAARRTQDLYVGSVLLSSLASAGVESAIEQGVELLFPSRLENGNLPRSIPHRFAFISDSDPYELAGSIESAIRNRWHSVADMVKDWLIKRIRGGQWEDVFDSQVEAWLEFHWVAVPYNSKNHGDSYEQVLRAMAARKQARTFPQVWEPGDKCTLTGAQSALPLDWHRLRSYRDISEIVLRPNERLGALGTIKRFLQYAAQDDSFFEEVQRFPDITNIAGGERGDGKPHYFAILHMDGDRMGKLLSQMKTIEDHQNISRKLAYFAEQSVPSIITKHIQPSAGQLGTGRLVYAGGDDVLALLPLWAVIPCADEIRSTYEIQIGGTMSAGVAITPHQLPFGGALDEARTAEHRAKDVYRRNAIVIRQNTGQIREAGAQWGVIRLIEDLQVCFQEDYLSGKLGYDILQLAHDLDLSEQNLSNQVSHRPPEIAIAAEAGRLLKRRTQEGLPDETKESIATLAEDFRNHTDPSQGQAISWESLANWIILARFLAKGVAGQ